MSIKAARSEPSNHVVTFFETPSVLIERDVDRATEALYCDGSRIPDTATLTEKSDLVLPSPETKRWSSRRKAAILVAVRTGVVTRQEACERYFLSEEEFASWEVAFDRAGIHGLLVTRLQSYGRRRLSRIDGVS